MKKSFSQARDDTATAKITFVFSYDVALRSAVIVGLFETLNNSQALSLLKGAKGRVTLLGKTFNWTIYGLA